MILSEPRDLAGALLQRFFPSQRDDRGGDDEIDEETHPSLGLVMTLALGVEPVTLSLLIGVIDVAGKRFWRSRGRGRRNGGLDGLGRGLRGRRNMLTDHGRFADPFFDGLIPDQRDQRGGEDEFEQEAHGGRGESYPLWVISYQGDRSSFTLTNNY